MPAATASTCSVWSAWMMIWCSSTRSRWNEPEVILGEYVAEVPACHLQGDIDVHLLVRDLDIAGLSALALDDADDLEFAAADAERLADGALRGQELSGAELGEHRHRGLFLLVGGQEDPAGQDLSRHQVEPFRRRPHHAQLHRPLAQTGSPCGSA